MNTDRLRWLANRHSAFYILSHGWLLWRITTTELASRYAGAVLGLAWALLAPLFILSLYAATYTMILRVQVQDLSSLQYTLFIFAGLVPFLSTAEALTQGVSSVVANRTLLTNTVFPIDLAPVKAVLLSQVVMAVGMAALVLGLCVTGEVRATVVLLPIVWLLQVFAITGVVWFLSLLNVILRDLQMFLAVLTMTLMIASPIAYGPENVPERLRFLLLVNPFAWFVMAYQKILVFGEWLTPGDWLALVACSAVLFCAGGYFFSCMKKAIIDHA
ncbi:MAG: ABC transporter permease [Planctomycetes bacterium]|nr:ABC transporter permease [Planctomycetota bacterium]